MNDHEIRVTGDPYDVGDYLAPENMVWVCGHCGKRSMTKYGISTGYKKDHGYDESCMLNSVLCWAEMRDGIHHAVEIKDYPV